MLHNSLGRFSTGVPVSANRCSARTRLAALATLVDWFLMYWASSSVQLKSFIFAKSSTSMRRMS